jgi:hypothetical protein
MSMMAQKVNNRVQSVTVDTTIVPIGDSPTVRATASFQKSLWPLTVIGVAALSSVLWMFALLWVLGHAIW